MPRDDRKPVDFASLEHADTSSNTDQYRISALLRGHTDDVRALTSDASGRLYSASRDGTVKSWRRRTGDESDGGTAGEWELEKTWSELHEGFINSICWVAPRAGVGEQQSERGLLCTSGQDSLIQIVSLSPPDAPPRTLLGHGPNVCCLHPSSNGAQLVSGSWDCTARVWSLETGECLEVLTEHGAAVWDVLSIDVKGYEGTTLTACADGLIRSFRMGVQQELFKGHQGPVRALAKVMPEEEDGLLFASASNDGTIRIWHLNGSELNVLDGHDSFIYSLVSIPSTANGGLASSGEDGIIRVWGEEDGELEQEVLVPPLSVWSLATIRSGGDLACGCSDNNIWVFTRAEKRRANNLTQQEYVEGLDRRAKSRKAKEQNGQSGLPRIVDEEELKEPGTEEGEVRVVETDAGGLHAYTWNGSTWQDVGQVVSAPPSTAPASSSPGARMIHDGVEYDYVFSIDVKDDEPPLKLPYNFGDDLHETATAFIKEHSLPDSYTDQIIAFIRASSL